jgi:hypothetical protein
MIYSKPLKIVTCRLVFPAKLSFRVKGEIKTFQDKHKLKEFMISNAALWKILKGILYKRKINIVTGAQERINPSQRANKQMKTRN